MSTTAAKAARSHTALRDELIVEHLSLVTVIATRVRETLPVHVELDDLIHAGVMGLFDAATKFDANKQVAFAAYAKHRIKGAILDGLRHLDCASRDMRRRQRQVQQVTRDLTAKLERQPTDAEMADEIGVSIARWRQIQVELGNLNIAATQNHKHEDEEQTHAEPPCSSEMQPDRVFARAELRARLDSAKAALPSRYQQVVTLYYDRDMTMKEIGNTLGVKESRVSQIHKSALARMQVELQHSGIPSSAVF